jgi:hypothetical protein
MMLTHKSSALLFDRISNLDPVWEGNYERQFFDFTEDTGGIFSATDDDAIVNANDQP